jgi:hypothetical protein
MVVLSYNVQLNNAIYSSTISLTKIHICLYKKHSVIIIV